MSNSKYNSVNKVASTSLLPSRDKFYQVLNFSGKGSNERRAWGREYLHASVKVLFSME